MSVETTGTFRLAEQIGSWAVFAEITVKITSRIDNEPLVRFDNMDLDVGGSEAASIEFGVRCALKYLQQPKDTAVVVQTLHTNPVDTTPAVLAFAACHAVLACFEPQPAVVPIFDRESRSFVFPAR